MIPKEVYTKYEKVLSKVSKYYNAKILDITPLEGVISRIFAL